MGGEKNVLGRRNCMDKDPEARGRGHSACREFQRLLEVACSEPEIKGCYVSLSHPKPHEQTVRAVLRISVFSSRHRSFTEMYSAGKDVSSSQGHGAEL